MKVHEALRRASSFLAESGREARAAEILLGHALGASRTQLFMQMQEEMPEAAAAVFGDLIRAHAGGIPVQHLTGTEPFFGRTFHVSRDVLIPRPETEELVAHVLETIPGLFGGRQLAAVDVGTGSGVIAATLAMECEQMHVSAVDVSPEALAVAVRNAERLGARVDFYEGDLLAPFMNEGKKFDLIVSNLPYIPEEEAEALDPLVKDHEPSLALYGGKDGLSLYRQLIGQIPKVETGGPCLIAFEIGIGQSEAVSGLIRRQFGDRAQVSVLRDINGKERIVSAVIGK
ncbi:MAG TPA: peptide chain release factor N(5)-glutamine methyltransferase [Bacillales bacterium]|nr:peptide chain release factor N(5)-glutamine methyltransferase [Bacillales bacterium]